MTITVICRMYSYSKDKMLSNMQTHANMRTHIYVRTKYHNCTVSRMENKRENLDGL